MQATIVNFRRGRHRQTTNHFILLVKGIDSKEKASKLIGKEVSWKNPIGKNKVEINGKIASTHGNKGALRAIFERGLPGQALSTKVEIK